MLTRRKAQSIWLILDFWAWWISELTHLSNVVADWFRYGFRSPLLLRLHGSDVELFRYNNSILGKMQTLPAQGFAAAERYKGRSCIIVFSYDDILSKRFALPGAAIKNIRSIVEFQLDKATPFAREEVFFDFGDIRTDAAAKLIHVDVSMVPKKYVEDAVQSCREIGLVPVSAIGVSNAGKTLIRKQHFQCNASAASAFFQRASIGLATATACLLAVAGAMPFYVQHKETTIAEQAYAQARGAARKTAAAQSAITEINANRRFIIEKTTSNQTFIAKLNALSKEVPDHTWITKLTYANGNLLLQGITPSSDEVLAILEKSNHFQNIRLVKTASPSGTTGKQRVQVSLRSKRVAP